MHQEFSSDEPEFMSRPLFPWVTWFIVASTFAVFLLQLWEQQIYHFDIVGERLAFSREALIEHRYWTLVSYAWAHATDIFGYSGLFWLHVVSNMLPIICLGPALEDMLGHARYLGLYLGGAVVSVLVWHFLNVHNNEPIIGASGAVFAVLAAIGTAASRARVMVLLFFVLPIGTTLRVLVLVVCAIELVQIPLRWMPDVAHSAHLAGAAFGFLYICALHFMARRRHLPV